MKFPVKIPILKILFGVRVKWQDTENGVNGVKVKAEYSYQTKPSLFNVESISNVVWVGCCAMAGWPDLKSRLHHILAV